VIGPPVIQVEQLTRSYGAVVAINDVSLTIESGVVGLLGPNGAGKSTLLKTLTGELRPGIGSVQVLGMTPFANPDLYARIGICPEQDAMFEDMTGREFVAFLLRLRGLEGKHARDRADAWLDRMGLTDARDRKLRGYSKGMRQRTKLCTAFAHEPELVFLDEPLTGLDPLWRHHVQTLVRERADAGATVLFSSHVLHEVEQVTREVVLLHRGRVAAQGNSREIRALIDRVPHRVEVLAREPRRVAVLLAGWDCVESVRVRETGVDVTTTRPDLFYALLTESCAADHLGVEGLSSPDDSLQALFDTLVNVRPERARRRPAS
jgi:ABC-2 type transport system ATP-binding protein